MSKNKKESFFWTSYSDLMTSLFFVMLVLFVLTIGLLHKHIDNISKTKEATDKQLEKIKEIETSTQNISPSYFNYEPAYKKHVLNIKVQFSRGNSNIDEIDSFTKQNLLHAGRSLQNSISEITSKYPEIQYLLIIEGQASKDNFRYNYSLSYDRALSLKKYWEYNGIQFGNNCEVLIAGSGDGTLSGTGNMRNSEEEKNQRFLIHIVPKPGMIENFNQ